MFTLNDSVGTTLKYTETCADNKGKCIDIKPSDRRLFVKDARVHDANFTFLKAELAKLHEKTYEPKWNITYSQDVPVVTGGGLIDFVEYYTTDWAGIMNDTRNIVGNNGNIVPKVNAQMTQNRVPTFTYEIGYDLRFIELEKMKKTALGKSIEQIYESGIRAGWEYFCQRVAYFGSGTSEGLFNNSKVQATTIDNSSATGKGFEGLEDDAIVSFFNGVFSTFLSETNMNPSLIPDTFLVPMFVQEDLANRFSNLYTNSLHDFLVAHNLGLSQVPNFKLNIVGRPDLDTLGSGSHGRIVAYKKDKDFVRMDVTYPIQHYITLPNVDKMCYTTVFVGQTSAIQLPYNTTSDEAGAVKYFDFTK